MSTQVLNQIIQQVELLTEKEKEQLNHYLKTTVYVKQKRKKWQNIRGLMAYSPSAEDAQIAISNARKEADKKREQ
ncbi:MAG: hypothetical protein NTY50_16130 [Methylobacter sp.]|nr:hypothetical protein [Methylobacter sp.]